MDISFEYYKIFYYVAKYENITKAAMVLKSSQPNVTRIIHILEDQLDCRLFLREPRGLRLTEEGKRLYAHVAIACQHLLDAEAELCRDKNVCSGTIELGVTETALHLFLLQNLHDFQTGYPEIKIRIQNNTTPEILKSLQNGRLDLAVVTTPFELHDALACEDLLSRMKTAIPPVTEETPAFRDIHISNVICRGSGRAMFFNGLPEMPIRNVTVKNVVMTEATDGVVISQVDGVTLENIYVESTKGKNILNVKSAKNLKVDGETYEEIDAKGQILNFK